MKRVASELQDKNVFVFLLATDKRLILTRLLMNKL